MANAGRHNDTRILKEMIREGKLIKIYSYEHKIIQKIKARFNHIVMHDEAYNSKFNGKKYVYHKAWQQVDKALLWANQLRIKYWYYEPLRY